MIYKALAAIVVLILLFVSVFVLYNHMNKAREKDIYEINIYHDTLINKKIRTHGFTYLTNKKMQYILRYEDKNIKDTPCIVFQADDYLPLEHKELTIEGIVGEKIDVQGVSAVEILKPKIIWR